MKKLLIFLLFALSAHVVFGQTDSVFKPQKVNKSRFWLESEPQHEFRLSIGAYPITPLHNWNSDWDYSYNYLYNFGDTKFYQGATYTTGVISTGYSYRYNRWTFGVSLSYMREDYKIYSNLDNSMVARRSINCISVIPNIRFIWLQRRSVRMYSSFGLGIMGVAGDRTNDMSSIEAAAQFNYIGLSVGRRFFGFAELGVGSMGSIIGGIGYKFNGKNEK